jgi:flavin-dependent dehydrogenase
MLFTWAGTFRADAVVGAFGTGRVMADTFARRTAYRPPPLLETLVTKHHPLGEGSGDIPDLLGNFIHVFLPPLPRIEFGALIPKGDHVTAIIAGSAARTDDMTAFLALPAVRRLADIPPDPVHYYRGRFPVGLARGYYGDRYVTVGDAAGLVRPFKGKGITSAVVTGGLAAAAMLDAGISAAALREFARGCAEITGDLWYGRLVRGLAWITGHWFAVDPLVRQAHADAALRDVLFDCVSGRDTYRRIVLRRGNPALALRLALALTPSCLRRRG